MTKLSISQEYVWVFIKNQSIYLTTSVVEMRKVRGSPQQMLKTVFHKIQNSFMIKKKFLAILE